MSGLVTSAVLIVIALGTRVAGLRLWWSYAILSLLCALSVGLVYGLAFAWDQGWLYGVELWDTSGLQRTVHDTYYIVVHGHFIASAALLFAVTAIVCLLTRRAPDSRTDVFVFWALLLTWLARNVGIVAVADLVPMPRRYVDYPEYFSRLMTVQSTLFIILSALFLAAIALRLRAYLRHR